MLRSWRPCYTDKPADSEVLLAHRVGILGYLRSRPAPRRWDEWLSWEPAIGAIYRQSPRPLTAEPMGHIDVDHPPHNVPGMLRVNVDGNGRLVDFSEVPRPADPALAPAVGPETVFRAARLDMAAFTETTPVKYPSFAFDQLRAWKGPHPHLAGMQLQVEAAWWKGRIVRVRVLYPWEQKPDAPARAGSTLQLRDIGIPLLGSGCRLGHAITGSCGNCAEGAGSGAQRASRVPLLRPGQPCAESKARSPGGHGRRHDQWFAAGSNMVNWSLILQTGTCNESTVNQSQPVCTVRADAPKSQSYAITADVCTGTGSAGLTIK